MRWQQSVQIHGRLRVGTLSDKLIRMNHIRCGPVIRALACVPSVPVPAERNIARGSFRIRDARQMWRFLLLPHFPRVLLAALYFVRLVRERKRLLRRQLGLWIIIPEVPGSNAAPCHQMDLGLVAPDSTHPLFENSQARQSPATWDF